MLRYGDTPKCFVEAESTIIPHVRLDFKDNSLCISATRFKYKTSKKITVYLTTDTTIHCINTQKGNHVNSQGLLQADRLIVNARQASNINLNVEAQQIDLHISGSSAVSMTGTCQNTYVDISDTSLLWTHFLKSINLEINSDYYCKCKVFASDAISIKALNGSNIEYITERGASRNINFDNTTRVVKVDE